VPTSKILVVDDFKGFRQFTRRLLQRRTQFEVIEASDGLEAVQKAKESQPDVVLLDIGLPKLNGLEVARQIRRLSSDSKILFLSQESSAEIVREALSLGGYGYVHKPRAGTDLPPAIDAVLRGKRFVSIGLERSEGTDAEAPARHEILFCSDDSVLLDGLTRFIANALKARNAAIVWATESHRDSILQRLRAEGVDVDAAIQRGTYIAADVAEPPDPARMLRTVRRLSDAARQAGNEHPRVAICGERAGHLWAEGKTDLAIGLEQFLNELAKGHEIDILCPYPSPGGSGDDSALKVICAEHSAASFR
jgi:DNA-binding NarL/FixJ family response regulator